MSGTLPSEHTGYQHALEEMERSARTLEEAYRELWRSRESERRRRELALAERLRDLAHDLKNPLGGVRGLAILLQRELDRAPENETALRLAARIAEGVGAVEAILRERIEPQARSADAAAIAEETCALARAESMAEGSTITFAIDVPAGIDAPLAPSKLREVLANLVRNACEACAPLGRVAVRVETTADEIILCVEDNGRGLPPEPAGRLFARGFSTKGENRGLGLAIVREIAREAAGTITLERMPQGTRATARFPRRRAT
jgi:two-component system OmpR family sensor kinase